MTGVTRGWCDAPVVYSGHVTKPLLASDVPQLQPHYRVLAVVDDLLVSDQRMILKWVGHLKSKIYANCGPVMFRKELMDITLDDTGFATPELSDNQDLEDVLSSV